MKKTIVYIFILIALGSAIAYLWKGRNDGMETSNESNFNIKDTAAIYKIFIAEYDGSTVLLDRTDTGWMLNKNFKALPSMVNLILNTIYNQQSLYPVTKNAVPNALKDLATMGVKVETYDKKGKLLIKFYVGGAAPNSSGTYMMIEGAAKPYVVQIQNFVGTLSNRYSGRIKDWRDRTVISLPASEIKKISMKYFFKPENSFVIEKTNNNLSVAEIEPSKTKTLGDLNLHNANDYLNFFTNINCEGFLNGTDNMDSLIKYGARHSTIDIEGIHGQNNHIEIYWMGLNKRSKNRISKDNEIPDDYDTDRLYALINDNKDTVLIQQFVFRRIFRRISDFYRKDSVKVN